MRVIVALRGFVLLVGVLLSSRVVRADRPPPLSAQTLTAPGGPTSLKGLGESFQPNPATGTGSYSVPIQLPPGLVVPAISLDYVAGSGSGELGVGFSLPILHVYRVTDKGVPKFDENDRFAVSGPDYNEELVLADAAQRLYRMKNEDSFTLFRRDTANDRWIVMNPNGLRSVLGDSVVSRARAQGKTTRWFVASTMNQFGNQVLYRYVTDQAKVYWKGVDYQQQASAAYRNRVEFEYEARPDAVHDYRYGDVEITAQRLRRIDVFQGLRRLRSYTLGYDPSALYSLLTAVGMEGEDGLAMPTLRFGYLGPSTGSGPFVRMEGFRTLAGLDTGRMTLEDVNADGLPDLLSGQASNYEYYENVDGVRFSNTPVRLGVSASADRSLDAPGVVLADVDGDGVRDVFYSLGAGQFRYFPAGRVNSGVFAGYGPALAFNGNGVVSDITAALVRLTDLNADGRTDLLFQRPGVGDVWVENDLGRQFLQRTMPSLPAGVRLDSPGVELLEFNGDGFLDLVVKEFNTGNHRLRVFYGLGAGRFVATARVWSAPAASAKEVYLSDVNRDGQTDLVRVSGSWVSYCLNDGRGNFAVRHGDFRGMPETSRTKKILFADMNGNGTTDVVWLTIDGQLAYLDLMREPQVGLLSRIDNGMGLVTDIGYRDSTSYLISAKLAGTPWSTPMSQPVPVVSEVSTRDSLDRLGVASAETRSIYNYRDGYYDGREREFRGFARVSVTESGDVFHEGQTTELSMHVGRNLATGADEEPLKGKVWLELVKTATGALLTSEEAKWELRWLCQEDLGAGAPPVLPKCAGIADRMANKDRLTALVVRTGALRGSWERLQTARYTAQKRQVGAWGKPARVEDYGEVTLPGGHVPGQPWDFADLSTAIGNDEKAEETDYANRIDLTTNEWLLGYPTEHRLKTLAGATVTTSRSYYDGAALVGLPFGQLTRGLVTRRDVWFAEEARWVSTERTGYTAEGLPERTVDATGRTSILVYDPETRFFPLEERMQLGGGREAVFVAGYDRGLGVVTSLRDPNARLSRYGYDSLGRLTRVIDPLSSDAEPSVRYDYAYGTPEIPISSTTTRTLVERGRGIYRRSVTYSDAAGRPRLVKTATDTGFVGSGYQVLSARGGVAQAFEPFTSSHDRFEAAPFDSPHTDTFFDALGRSLEEHLPITDEQGASFRAHEYRPFETSDYDERDSTEGTFRYPTITRVDGLGRVRQIEKTNQRGPDRVRLVWTLGYDARGGLTSFTDPQGIERTYGYDALARLTMLRDPNLGTVRYRYDDAARVTRRTDALGQERRSEYDAAGRIALESFFKPDAGGVLRAAGQCTYRYDAPQPNGPLPGAENLIGRLSFVEFASGSDHYSYDARGEPLTHVAVLWNGTSPLAAQERTTQTRRLEYDAVGQEVRRVLPGGFEVTTGYDARGLLQRLSAGLPGDSRALIDQVAYDARGNAVALRQGNGLRACRSHDARGNLSAVLVGKTSEVDCDATDFAQSGLGVYHARFTRSYDRMLAAVTDLGATRPGTDRLDASYGYDRLHQLVSAETPRGRFAYGYDDLQNLTTRSKAIGAGAPVLETLTYGESAGPGAVTRAGSTALAYDAAGQLEHYNGYDLEFGVRGELVAAVNPNGKRTDYYYDAFGRRRLVVASDAGRKRVFRYPFPEYEEREGEVVVRLGSEGLDVELRQSDGLRLDAVLLDELVAYVNAPQGRPAPLPGEWLDLDGDGDGFDAGDLAEARTAFWAQRPAGSPRVERRFVQLDELHSALFVTDGTGAPASARRYEPFGKLAQRRGLQPSRGHAGAEIDPDEELGLVHMGARYYAPDLGRWISPDLHIGESPARMQETVLESGLYSYARNNPAVFADPTGRDAVVRIKGDKITVEANIYIYGKGASKAVAANIQNAIMKDWGADGSGKPWKVIDPGTGKTYTVEFKVNVRMYGKADAWFVAESWQPSNTDNFIEIKPGKSPNDDPDYVMGGDEGAWYAGSSGTVFSHEFGHLVGLTDRYEEGKDAKGNRATTPKAGWSNNIMSDLGRIEQHNVYGIVADPLIEYNKFRREWKQKTGSDYVLQYKTKIDESNPSH